MSATTKSEKILEEARERYDDSVLGWNHIYEEASNDLKFIYDVDEGQWPQTVREEREDERRPIITVNKLQKFARQLRGDFLQNRPSMKVIPVDNKSDIQMAELYNGLIRQIEYLSDAAIAYDTAYAHAIACSIGYFRIISQYSDENSFDQDLYIKRIIDPFSIHFDPYATEFELEDAQYCFVEESVERKLFEKQYPKSELIGYEGSNDELYGDWMQKDRIRIAEYFYKEPVVKKIVQLKDGSIVDAKDAKGEVIREREITTHKIKWCKINGVEILEESEWPGKYIPIIPMFGDEVVVDGKKYYLSAFRGAKGSQQMYNFWSSAATETVALAPKIPVLVDHRQIKGFENEWADAHKRNRPYIRYNAIPGLDKPSRERQPDVPVAMINMMQTCSFDIEDHLGRYESSKGMTSNERSGAAIKARIQQSDKGTFAYVNNALKAVTYGAKQLIDLIPKIYDTQRALQVMDEAGQSQMVDINVPAVDSFGNITKVNDLSVGKYDVVATTGMSYGSKRQEMVDSLIQAMQYAPNMAQVIAPFIFKFADFPGAQEVYAELKQQMEAMAQQAQSGQPAK